MVWFLSPSLGDMFGKVKGKLCNFCTILFRPVDVPASWLVEVVGRIRAGNKGDDLSGDGIVMGIECIPFRRIWGNFLEPLSSQNRTRVEFDTLLAVVQQEFGELVRHVSGLNFHGTIVVHVGEVVQ